VTVYVCGSSGRQVVFTEFPMTIVRSTGKEGIKSLRVRENWETERLE